jgi:hypothetical protein
VGDRKKPEVGDKKKNLRAIEKKMKKNKQRF